MKKSKVILDTDIIINWLTKEENLKTGFELWKAPHRIIKSIEDNEIEGFLSLLSLFEIRFVLRRKKKFSNKIIEEAISDIVSNIQILIPDEIVLLKSNQLQVEEFLDPFDSILLSLALKIESGILITRDKEFIRIAKKIVDVMSPEEFIKFKP
ncbi:MAG: type II toxin-antitoxin system VapC family toxin [Candidatus Methanofastidiosia archaeon]